MDISAILPVNMGNDTSSLNDDFSGQTPAGDNIFSKALGNKTYFRTTEGGLVVVSFIFDPKQPYGQDHQMASVTADWMGDMRDCLTKLIVDAKDIAPKTKSLEETVWDQVTSALPKETLAKNLFADKKVFEDYMALLKSQVTKNFTEEKALTAAMTTKKYSFSFEIAIDAYPHQISGGAEKKPSDKSGVLTFHIEGCPDGVAPSSTAPVEEPKEGDEKKTKKRKTTESNDANDRKKSKKDKDAEKLLNDLQLYDQFRGPDVHKSQHKMYPLTATQFFEMINRWFSSTVSRKATKLEKDRNRNPLYH